MSEVNHFAELNDAVEVSASAVVLITEDLINKTIARARKAVRKRARILLHPQTDDSLHEMLVALPRESCDVPHINFKSGKSFHIVRGEMAVMVFSDDGKKTVSYRLKAGDSGLQRMLRLNKASWHTIIPLSEYAVFIETISGPFIGNQFAPWAAAQEKERFADDLRKIANQ